jgi:hypothetical protein
VAVWHCFGVKKWPK